MKTVAPSTRPAVSRSEAVRVAVGFNPRLAAKQTADVAERRSNGTAASDHSSVAPRRPPVCPTSIRGLKPTATIALSLRDVTSSRLCPARKGASVQRVHGAFSLIELIGVLAVIAILAAVLAPSFVRQMDKTAGDQESATLKSLGDALQSSIMRHRYIPGDTDWATNIATELGVDLAAVTTNQRQQPRYFLIDPNLSIAGAPLPYTQTSAGAADVPDSSKWRVIILSSVGRNLPAAFNSGVPASANFNAIWDWKDAAGALPATGFAWPGWPDSDDLRVQRVNLSPLFVKLLLNCSVSSRCNCPSCPSYSIDQTNSLTSVSSGITTYFIQNSILYLYNHDGTLDSQQILIRDNSFIYDQNTWRGSIGGEGFLAGLDIASTVDRYLAAYPNVRAQNGTNQQAVVVQSMINFMDRYDVWAAANFPTNSGDPLYAALTNAQVAMTTSVRGQYQKGGGSSDYSPNEVPCQ